MQAISAGVQFRVMHANGVIIHGVLSLTRGHHVPRRLRLGALTPGHYRFIITIGHESHAKVALRRTITIR